MEFYAIDVVGVDGSGGEMWVGVSFREICGSGDAGDGGGDAG